MVEKALKKWSRELVAPDRLDRADRDRDDQRQDGGDADQDDRLGQPHGEQRDDTLVELPGVAKVALDDGASQSKYWEYQGLLKP